MHDEKGIGWKRVKVPCLIQNRLVNNFRFKFKYIYFLRIINKIEI